MMENKQLTIITAENNTIKIKYNSSYIIFKHRLPDKLNSHHYHGITEWLTIVRDKSIKPQLEFNTGTEKIDDDYERNYVGKNMWSSIRSTP